MEAGLSKLNCKVIAAEALADLKGSLELALQKCLKLRQGGQVLQDFSW